MTEEDIVTHITHTFKVKVIPTTQKAIDIPLGGRQVDRAISLQVLDLETYKYSQSHCYTCDRERFGKSSFCIPCPSACSCYNCDPAGN